MLIWHILKVLHLQFFFLENDIYTCGISCVQDFETPGENGTNIKYLYTKHDPMYHTLNMDLTEIICKQTEAFLLSCMAMISYFCSNMKHHKKCKFKQSLFIHVCGTQLAGCSSHTDFVPSLGFQHWPTGLMPRKYMRNVQHCVNSKQGKCWRGAKCMRGRNTWKTSQPLRRFVSPMLVLSDRDVPTLSSWMPIFNIGSATWKMYPV